MLAEMDKIDFEVIFVTAHNNYMLQALQFSAADYLLKPVDEDRLTEAMQRVEKRLGQKGDNNTIDTLLYNLQKAGSPNEMKLCIPTLKGFVVLRLKRYYRMRGGKELHDHPSARQKTADRLPLAAGI